MKKLFATALAATLAMSMSATAMAAGGSATNTGVSQGEGASNPTTIAVNGTYVEGTGSQEKISVDIAWESMDFTYDAGNAGTWNTTTHTYDGVVAGSWSNNKPNITVTNHSNVDVQALLKFDQNTDLLEEVNGYGRGYIYGTFEETSGTANDDVLELASAAEGESLGNPQKAPTATTKFGISGDPIDANVSLGTITITIRPSVMMVYTARELIDAVGLGGLGGKIKLANDISSNEIVDIWKDTELDLNGKTLTFTNDAYVFVREGVEAHIQNGTITGTGDEPYSVVYGREASLTIDNCTLTRGAYEYYALMLSGSTAVVRNCTVNGGIYCFAYNNKAAALTATDHVTVTKGTEPYTGLAVAVDSTATFGWDPTDLIAGGHKYEYDGIVTDNGDGTWTLTSTEKQQ